MLMCCRQLSHIALSLSAPAFGLLSFVCCLSRTTFLRRLRAIIDFVCSIDHFFGVQTLCSALNLLGSNILYLLLLSAQ